MDEFKIGQRVEHPNTQISGHVIGIFIDRRENRSMLVEYRNSIGDVRESYFPSFELASSDKPAEANAAGLDG